MCPHRVIADGDQRTDYLPCANVDHGNGIPRPRRPHRYIRFDQNPCTRIREIQVFPIEGKCWLPEGYRGENTRYGKKDQPGVTLVNRRMDRRFVSQTSIERILPAADSRCPAVSTRWPTWPSPKGGML